jgi:hypothetical protein
MASDFDDSMDITFGDQGDPMDSAFDDPIDAMIATVDRIQSLLAHRSMRRVEAIDLTIPGMGDSFYLEDERFLNRFPGGPEREVVEALIQSPFTSRLTSLRCQNMFLADTIAVLTGSALLGQLKWLDLSFSFLGDQGMAILVRSPRFGSVETLLVRCTGIGDGGVAALSACGHTTGLRRLDLSQNVWSNDAVRSVASCGHLAELRTLKMSGVGSAPKDKALELLASSDNLLRLQSLTLEYMGIDPSGIEALCRETGLPELASLRIGGNPIGDDGLSKLSESPRLRRLEVLELWDAKISPSGVRALANSSTGTGVTHLDLGTNELGDEGVKELARARSLTSVRSLRLAGCRIGATGCEALGNSEWPRLASLNLGGNPIGDAGLAALTRSPLFKQLNELLLPVTGITDDGVRALVRSAHPASWKRLELGHNDGIGEQAKGMLRQRFGSSVCI